MRGAQGDDACRVELGFLLQQITKHRQMVHRLEDAKVLVLVSGRIDSGAHPRGDPRRRQPARDVVHIVQIA